MKHLLIAILAICLSSCAKREGAVQFEQYKKDHGCEKPYMVKQVVFDATCHARYSGDYPCKQKGFEMHYRCDDGNEWVETN